MFGNNAETNIKAVITADDRASSTLKGFGKNVGTASKSIRSGMKQAAVGIAAVTTAAVAFGTSAVKAFMESENAIAQTNAVLKSTKGVAGVTAQAVDNLSASLQKVTKFSDEEIRSGQNLLLTFTKIGKDIFPQATETMLDMSEALGQDLKSSSIQLGKALNDPILGVTALRRVGVAFTKDQQEQIKTLVESGKQMEAQKLILKELKIEFGGSAKAAGKTFAGQLKILGNQFDEIKEKVGGALVKAFAPYVAKVAVYLQEHGPELEKHLSQLATAFVNVVVVVGKNYKAILAVIAAYKSLKIAIGIGEVMQVAAKAMNMYTASAGKAAVASMLVKAGWVGLAVAATALVGYGIYRLVKAWKDNADATDASNNATKRHGMGIINTTTLIKAEESAIRATKRAKDELAAATDKNTEAQKKYTNALKNGKTPAETLFNLEHNAIATALAYGVAQGKTASAIQRQADATKNLLSWKKALKAFMEDSTGVVKKFANQTLTAARNTIQLTQSIQSLQGQPKDVTSQLQGGFQSDKSGVFLQGTANPQGSRKKKASGGSVNRHEPYIVGEEGRELFVPKQDGVILPHNKTNNVLGGQSGVINLNVNVGMYAGSEQEKRKIAMELLKSLKDIAGARSTTVSQMLGA